MSDQIYKSTSATATPGSIFIGAGGVVDKEVKRSAVTASINKPHTLNVTQEPNNNGKVSFLTDGIKQTPGVVEIEIDDLLNTELPEIKERFKGDKKLPLILAFAAIVQDHPEINFKDYPGLFISTSAPNKEFNIKSEGVLCVNLANQLDEIYAIGMSTQGMLDSLQKAALTERSTHSLHDRTGVLGDGDFTEIKNGTAVASVSLPGDKKSEFSQVIVQVPEVNTVRYMDAFSKNIQVEGVQGRKGGRDIIDRNGEIAEEFMQRVSQGDTKQMIKLLLEQRQNHRNFMELEDQTLKGLNEKFDPLLDAAEEMGLVGSYVGAPGGDTIIFSGEGDYQAVSEKVIELMKRFSELNEGIAAEYTIGRLEKPNVKVYDFTAEQASRYIDMVKKKSIENENPRDEVDRIEKPQLGLPKVA